MTQNSVAFLIDYYRPFEVGGAERSAAALARALGDAGVRVLIVTPNYGAPRCEVEDGVDIVRLPFPQKLEPGRLARRLWSGNVVLQLMYGCVVAWLVCRRRVRWLHVQNSQMVIAGAVASLWSRRPMVVTVRDLAYIAHSKRESSAVGWRFPSIMHVVDAQYMKVEHRLKLLALRRATQIVFVSRGLQAVYAADAPAWLISRSRVVYNIGPKPTETADEPRPPIVLFVGKMSSGKGIHVLYDAIPDITRQIPAVTFELVGQPGVGWSPPPAAVQQKVRLRGRLDDVAVAELMTRAAVLVSPSIWPEPLSRVLLEAMSRRVPIVATTVGGTTEVVDESTAILVPPADATALSDAVVRLLLDPGFANSLQQNAARRYRDMFTGEQIVPQVLEVYASTQSARLQ